MKTIDICATSGPDRPLRAAPSRVEGLAIALSAALLVVSIVAAVLQHLDACGACATHQGPWALVALMGGISYAVLTAVGCLGWSRLFRLGAAAAAAVHTALVAAMVARGQFCLLCGVAAGLAAGLFLVTLVRSTSRMKFLAGVYLPALILASGPTAWALARERAAEHGRQSFIRDLQGAIRQDRLTIQVFEQDHCGYCRDFREFHLPKLEREFHDRIHVQFHVATATGWVRRTPTIVVEGGPVYEGLPENYQELRSAVEQALAARK